MINVSELPRAVIQWVPFAARTAFFGSISLLFGPLTRDHGASTWAMRVWARRSAWWLGLQIRAQGLENVPETGAWVYCANHQSLVDILALGAVLPGDYKWAAKHELHRVPFLGWHLRLAGHVLVERGRGPEVASRVVERFVEVLGSGHPLLVFPEGTRSADGVLRPFKIGGFLAAVRAGRPVVPVALEGTWRLLRRGAISIPSDTRRIIRVRVGAPLYPAENLPEEARVADLRDRCHAVVERMQQEILAEPLV